MGGRTACARPREPSPSPRCVDVWLTAEMQLCNPRCVLRDMHASIASLCFDKQPRPRAHVLRATRRRNIFASSRPQLRRLRLTLSVLVSGEFPQASSRFETPPRGPFPCSLGSTAIQATISRERRAARRRRAVGKPAPPRADRDIGRTASCSGPPDSTLESLAPTPAEPNLPASLPKQVGRSWYISTMVS